MTVRNILNFPNKQLAFLVAKTMEIQQIQQMVSQLIEPELAPHVQVANYETGALSLSTANGAWASRLRFSLPNLLARLRNEGRLYSLKHIKVIVLPFDAAQASQEQLPARAAPPLETDVATALQSALKRLAKTVAEQKIT